MRQSLVRNRSIVAFSLILIVLCGIPLWPLTAQEQTPAQKTSTSDAVAAADPAVPRDNRLVVLICSTLIALNQANATGNYSVFREMGAPGFQVTNSTGQLTDVFADLRGRNFDLSPIMRLQPQLLRPAAIDTNGMLRVTGFFPTEPERLNFDLIYQSVNDQWRLFGIAADTAPLEGSGDGPDVARTSTESAPTESGVVRPQPTKASAAAGSSTPIKSALPDPRDRVDEVERAASISASTSTSSDKEGPYNPFEWFR